MSRAFEYRAIHYGKEEVTIVEYGNILVEFSMKRGKLAGKQ